MTEHSTPRLGELQPLPPRSLAYGTLFISPLGRERQAPEHPLIIYGHDALDTAAFMAEASTLCTLAVRSLVNLEKAIANHACIGIFAMSRPEHPGEAAQALRLFSQKNPGPGLKLYGAWTHDVHAAIEKALVAGAHGVIFPDTDAQEMFAYIFACLKAIGEGQPLPASAKAMYDHLRVAFPQSPFWNSSDADLPPTY